MNAAAYTIALASALKSIDLSPQLYAVLVCIANAQNSTGYATTPQLAFDLGVTFNAIRLQTFKSPQLFDIDRETHPIRIRLTPEGLAVLAEVKKRLAPRLKLHLAATP